MLRFYYFILHFSIHRALDLAEATDNERDYPALEQIAKEVHTLLNTRHVSDTPPY